MFGGGLCPEALSPVGLKLDFPVVHKNEAYGLYRGYIGVIRGYIGVIWGL